MLLLVVMKNDDVEFWIIFMARRGSDKRLGTVEGIRGRVEVGVKVPP
jgi:hypothetical protein